MIVFPGNDSGNERLLRDLLLSYPEPAFDVNRRLYIVGNSRASDLRAMGWTVVHETRTMPKRGGRRRVSHGYCLGKLPRLNRMEVPAPLRESWDRAVAAERYAA